MDIELLGGESDTSHLGVSGYNLGMRFFVKAIASGFAMSLGSAIFKKVSKKIGLDEKKSEEEKSDEEKAQAAEAEDELGESEIEPEPEPG